MMVNRPPFTLDIWIFGDVPKDAIEVPCKLILPRKDWQRFLKMLYNDKRLADELFSSLIGQKVSDWARPRSFEPEVLADILAAAFEKHTAEPVKSEIGAP